MQRLVRDPAQEKLRHAFRHAVMAMDLSWGRAMFPGAPDADIEIAMHKARYHATDVPRWYRHQSAQWLRERNLPDALGELVMPEGQLPR